jgi:hypothetical protein
MYIGDKAIDDSRSRRRAYLQQWSTRVCLSVCLSRLRCSELRSVSVSCGRILPRIASHCLHCTGCMLDRLLLGSARLWLLNASSTMLGISCHGIPSRISLTSPRKKNALASGSH